MSRLLAILGSLLLALTAAADAPRAVHDALFASYIPIEEVKDKPELVALFTEVRDQIWTAAGKAPAFQALLAPFTVVAQLLGFHTGVKKGFNPDEPKNLSRVVILD